MSVSFLVRTPPFSRASARARSLKDGFGPPANLTLLRAIAIALRDEVRVFIQLGEPNRRTVQRRNSGSSCLAAPLSSLRRSNRYLRPPHPTSICSTNAVHPNPPMCPLWYPFLPHPTPASFAAANYAACISLRMREAPGSACEQIRASLARLPQRLR